MGADHSKYLRILAEGPPVWTWDFVAKDEAGAGLPVSMFCHICVGGRPCQKFA